MNLQQIKKEGEKWVQDGIITKEQFEKIVSRYEKKDQSYLLVLFAVLFMSIGILIFAFSDWTNASSMLRVLLMVAFMTLLYFFGHRHYDSEQATSKQKNNIYGISFLLLGYIFFGATLFLIVNEYQITLFNVWPFIMWSLVGLLLYALYQHPYILTVGLLITIFSQMYSGLTFSSFDFIVFALFLFGYFHYVFHHERTIFSYLFAIGLALQLVMLVLLEMEQYYWLIVFSLAIYLLAEFIPKPILKRALFYISIWTVLLFKIYETFFLQEDYFVSEIEMQPLFFVVWGVLALLFLGLKGFKGKKLEMMDLILFLPLFFLPYHYLWIIISMFVFSIYWLIIGFQRNINEKIVIGMISFLISTFTAYIQFAWETLNRSLFFLIGGIILFGISFLLEKKRRTSVPIEKGADK